jgi:hypothetical protein
MAEETPPPMPPLETMVIVIMTGTTIDAAAMALVPRVLTK